MAEILQPAYNKTKDVLKVDVAGIWVGVGPHVSCPRMKLGYFPGPFSAVPQRLPLALQ